jgi:hypothetical protein
MGEQALVEIAFAQVLNIQYKPDGSNLKGIVAGYRVRRAPNGLVLLASDSDEDIFVAVRAGNERMVLRAGLVARSGGEASTVLSEKLVGHSARGLTPSGNAPRPGTAPGNARSSERAAKRWRLSSFGRLRRRIDNVGQIGESAALS